MKRLLPIRSSVIRLPAPRLYRHDVLRLAVITLCCVLTWSGAQAHGVAQPVAVPVPQALEAAVTHHDDAATAATQNPAATQWQAGLTLRYLDTQGTLPSSDLRGYLAAPAHSVQAGQVAVPELLLGVRQRLAGNAQAGQWLAEGAVSAHGGEAARVERGWLAYAAAPSALGQWQLGAGRAAPTLGVSGHTHTYTHGAANAHAHEGAQALAYARTPLAVQAVLGEHPLADGLELGWRSAAHGTGAGQWQFDAGLWRPRTWPLAPARGWTPSAHVGYTRGAWQWHASVQSGRVQQRSSAIDSTAHSHGTGAHAHAAQCSVAMSDEVCLTGRSTQVGLRVEWAPAHSQWQAQAAWLQRQERGTLQSASTNNALRLRTHGSWLALQYAPAARWRLGLRAERLNSRAHLHGPGAALLAQESGLAAYAPVQRQSVAVAYTLPEAGWGSWQLQAEAGRERSDTQRGHYRALSLRWAWN